MRVYRPRHLVRLDVVTVAELVDHSLSRRPEAVGITWPDSGTTVCRRHVEDRASRRLIVATRLRSDVATVLVGPDLAQSVRRLCEHPHVLRD